MKSILGVLILTLLISPINSFASTQQLLIDEHGTVHKLPITQNQKTKDVVYALMHAPKGWTHVVSTATPQPEEDLYFTLDNAQLGKSVGELQLITIPLQKNQKAETFVRKNAKERLVQLIAASHKVHRSGTTIIDGSRGYFVEYTTSDSNERFLVVTFTKFNRALTLSASLPESEWTKNKAAIEQSMSTLAVRTLALQYKK